METWVTWGWVLWARNEQGGYVHWYVGDLWETRPCGWCGWETGVSERAETSRLGLSLAVRVGLDLRPPATHTSINDLGRAREMRETPDEVELGTVPSQRLRPISRPWRYSNSFARLVRVPSPTSVAVSFIFFTLGPALLGWRQAAQSVCFLLSGPLSIGSHLNTSPVALCCAVRRVALSA